MKMTKINALTGFIWISCEVVERGKTLGEVDCCAVTEGRDTPLDRLLVDPPRRKTDINRPQTRRATMPRRMGPRRFMARASQARVTRPTIPQGSRPRLAPGPRPWRRECQSRRRGSWASAFRPRNCRGLAP